MVEKAKTTTLNTGNSVARYPFTGVVIERGDGWHVGGWDGDGAPIGETLFTGADAKARALDYVIANFRDAEFWDWTGTTYEEHYVAGD